jgi:predicted ATPase
MVRRMATPKRNTLPKWLARGGYLRSVELDESSHRDETEFPWCLPAIRKLGVLEFHPRVTYLVGDNGTGKSTLLEGIAEVAGFPMHGGSKYFAKFSERIWSDLGRSLKLVRNAERERDSFYLRAESFFDVSYQIEELAKGFGGTLAPYGGISPHQRSHGEAFMMLMSTRFVGRGLYLLDEPEAALSPTRQLAFLAALHRLATIRRSQFVIATHSPILMAYPDADMHLLSEDGIRRVKYEKTEHFQLYRDFLNDRESYFKFLFEDDGSKP